MSLPLSPTPQATSQLAIAGFILGVIPCVPGLGAVFGLMSLRKISLSDQRLSGAGLARAGIVLSTTWLVLFAALLSFLAVRYSAAKEVAFPFIEALQRNDEERARPLMATELASEVPWLDADFRELLQEMARLGPLQSLELGGQIVQKNEFLTVTFDANFEKRSVPIELRFVDQNGLKVRGFKFEFKKAD